MEADQEELDANEERIGAVVEHYEGARRIKAMHVLPTLQDESSDVLLGAPKGRLRQWMWPECSNGMSDRDPQANPRAGYRKANSRVFHQASENEGLGIIEQPAPAQAEEEMAACLGLLELISLEEGAM
jgi:hypothetical protein